MTRIYNLFISHSWSYSDDYQRLVNLLDDRAYFTYRNYSAPKNDPIHNAPNSQALYEAIKSQMAPSSVVIIMAGKYSTFSTWIKKELQIAKREFVFPKPILAIKPWASSQVSSVVRENAIKIVNWNTESIVNAIREISV